LSHLPVTGAQSDQWLRVGWLRAHGFDGMDGGDQRIVRVHFGCVALAELKAAQNHAIQTIAEIAKGLPR
jgi:hypothetical protein